MRKEDDNRSFVPLFQNLDLRLDGSIRNEREIADIQAPGVNHEVTPAARGSCTVKLTDTMKAVLPGTPSCDLMEGGLGI